MPEADSEKDSAGFAARSCAVDAHPLIGRTLHLLEEVVENGFGNLGVWVLYGHRACCPEEESRRERVCLYWVCRGGVRAAGAALEGAFAR